MHPLSPLPSARDLEPNFAQLRLHGWAVNACHGLYCVAFRGRDEVVFVWKDGAWRRVGGRGGLETD